MEQDHLRNSSTGNSPKARAVRSVLYLRMSTDRQETSIADQRSALTQHAAERGYRLTAEYVDEGISGDATEKRAAFQRLVADAVKKKFDLILCWDQDRFGRFDPIEGGYWIKPIRDAGVMLETIAQGRIDWTDFSSRLIWTVTQEAKHAYLRDLARNCARGLRSAVQAGVYPGMAPFGYRKEGKRLVLGPVEEVEVVREVFRLKALGMGYRTIANRLTKDGHPFPKSHIKSKPGSGWSSNQVRYIIHRRAYLGITVYGSNKARGKYANVGEAIMLDGTHPAIVTKDEFDAAQKSKRNNTVACRGGYFSSPFSGLMYCGLCGHVMYRFKYKAEYGFVCGTYHRAAGCGFCRIMDRDLSREMAKHITDLFGSDVDQIKDAIRRKIPQRVQPKSRAKLQSSLTDMDKQIARAADRLLTVPDEAVGAVRKSLAELARRRTELSDQIQNLKDRQPPDVDAVAERIQQIVQLIEHGDLGDKARALAVSLFSKIVADFEQIERGRTRRFFRLSGLRITSRLNSPKDR